MLEIQHTTRVEAPKLSNCMVTRGKTIHVGGVVLASEEEKCKNLFKLLNATVVDMMDII